MSAPMPPDFPFTIDLNPNVAVAVSPCGWWDYYDRATLVPYCCPICGLSPLSLGSARSWWETQHYQNEHRPIGGSYARIQSWTEFIVWSRAKCFAGSADAHVDAFLAEVYPLPVGLEL